MLDRANYGRAADLARQSSEEFLHQKRRDDEARSRAILAQAFAAQGKLAAARSEIGRSLGLVSKTQSRLDGFEIAIASTRVSGFLSEPLGANEVKRMAETLQKLATEAGRRGALRFELEAQLAVLELEAHSHQLSAHRVQLTTLQTKAREKGFVLIAQKAAILPPQ